MKFLRVLYLLLFLVSWQELPKYIDKITARNIAIDSTFLASAEIDSIIHPYKKELDAKMQKVLSYAPKDFDKKINNRQSSLGNLMAGICWQMSNPLYKETTHNNIDFALFNYGGMRAAIPKGNVTVENAFKLMPFENNLVVVTLTGEKVIELIEYFIKSKTAHPLSQHVQLVITKENYSLKINNQPFDPNETYTVLTSDYLQSGGDNMTFFKNPKELTKLNLKIRDAIIQYFQKTDTLQATIDNRVIVQL